MTTRIGYIKEQVRKAGGDDDFTVYIDTPSGSNSPAVVYKIANHTDGLTREKRKQLVDVLNTCGVHGIESAYLSRTYTNRYSYGQMTHKSGGHVKIRCTNLKR